MSWLQNLTGSKPPPPSIKDNSDGKSKAEKLEEAKATLAQAKEEKSHGFDPTGYERAAKAIREIDKSR